MLLPVPMVLHRSTGRLLIPFMRLHIRKLTHTSTLARSVVEGQQAQNLQQQRAAVPVLLGIKANRRDPRVCFAT